MDLVGSALEIFTLSMIFALISFSVYLTTSVMKLTDITCDSCVSLGGCVYGALVLAGLDPFCSFALAIIAGVIAGFVVSAITAHIRVPIVISSVITISILQTFLVKLFAFGTSAKEAVTKSGLSYLYKLTPTENAIIAVTIVLLFAIVFYRFLNSEYGLAMRVFGDGIIISESLGIDTQQVMYIGLGIANGLAATAGALMAQVTKHFSTIMGSGALVFGLAAVILGERLIEARSLKENIIACFMGAIFYKLALEVFTSLGTTSIGSEYNNVIMGVVLIFLMVNVNEQKKQHNMENF